MSNIAFYISMFFGCLSLALSFYAIKKAKEAKKLHSESIENLRAAHEVRQEVNQIVKNYTGYDHGAPEASSPSKYREYGDLS